MIVEGQRVVYAGESDPFNEVGAEGRVLVLSGHSAAHVQWSTGPKAGSVDLVEMHEIVPDRQQATALLAQPQPYLGDEPPTAVTASVSVQAMAVRSAYDEHGEDGVVSALEQSGHLALLADLAESTMLVLGTQIRSDAQIAPLLASLEPDEADTVVGKVASILLADCLKES